MKEEEQVPKLTNGKIQLKKVRIDADINSYPVAPIIDSGSERPVISENIASKAQLEIVKISPVKLKTLSKEGVTIYKETEGFIKFKESLGLV